VLFASQLALDLGLGKVADRAVVHGGTRREFVVGHGRQLLNEPNLLYRLASRRATFQTSPHVTHRQYAFSVTALLVVVISDDRHEGHVVGAATGSVGKFWADLK
jgi:hypothetical protein